MSTNKRIRKPSSKTMTSLLDEATPRRPKTLREQSIELESKVRRLEVEIAATTRMAHESRIRNRDTLPPPDAIRGGAGRSQARLSFAQSRTKRRALAFQFTEFTITLLLFVGACAWLYQWWLSRHGGF